ncbi:MAG: preprotein translocase subunit SecY [Anaerolineales bacterium]|nr:preprotein translocase subunit SecY [Anaerolineales bacterium]
MKRSPLRFLTISADIRNRLLISAGLLTLYRLVAHVPVPNINQAAIQAVVSGAGSQSQLLGLLDLLSGGTVTNFSVLAMGVYPYITAQIILQVLVPIIPSLQRRMEEDPREGRKWMERWTYLLAVPMATLQGYSQIRIFEQTAIAGGQVILVEPIGMNLATATMLISMTAGTMFAIWLGELISEFGIRNQGLSLIIFAGIVARIPAQFGRILADEQTRVALGLFMAALTVFTIFAIIIVQEGRRLIPVLYPGRRVGNRMSMPVRGTLPLMVNMAGMIPLIFAQAILTFPSILATFFVNAQAEFLRNLGLWLQNAVSPSNGAYWITYFIFVVFFTFFYTDVLFQQQNYGENLKRSGAQIPGVAQGVPTQRYLTRVLRRITLPGAFFLGLVAILPFLVTVFFPAAQAGGGLLITSAGLLIVVGVVRDVYRSIEAELKLRGYDSAVLVR